MKATVIKGNELDPGLVHNWSEIRKCDPNLASPYFSEHFTAAVAAVRDDVFIGVLEDGGKTAGFFPHHKRRWGVAQPVGLALSDYHGLVIDPNTSWSGNTLISQCGVTRWEFNHLIGTQADRFAASATIERSPIIEVAGGYAAYEAGMNTSGRKQSREAERKRVKLESQIGPLRYVEDSADPSDLRTMLRWKSEQCRRAGTFDFFALPWCVELIERIHGMKGEDFGGRLACLYAGDKLAAVHFYMRSGDVWHSWFPAYNNELHSYSPGVVLLLELIHTAADSGAAYIDLGKGMSTYKKQFMTGSIPVAEGVAEVPSLLNNTRHWWHAMERWGRDSALRPLLRIPGKLISNIRQKRQYD